MALTSVVTGFPVLPPSAFGQGSSFTLPPVLSLSKGLHPSGEA
jgi:hypothetical protein